MRCLPHKKQYPSERKAVSCHKLLQLGIQHIHSTGFLRRGVAILRNVSMILKGGTQAS